MMTDRDRRALRLGAGVLLLAVLGLRLLPGAARAVLDLRTRVVERAALVARQRAELAALPALEDSVARATTRIVSLAPALVPGRSRREAELTLTARLEHHLTSLGAAVERSTAEPDSGRVGDLLGVRVRSVAQLDGVGLAGLLARLAADPLALELVSLRITPTDPASDPATPERLAIELVVRGVRLARPAAGVREAR